MISPDCPSTTIHGTLTAYTDHGCRCERARAVCTAYQNDRRARVAAGGPNLVPPLGSRRRLQALAASSWGAVHLAPHFQRDHAQVHRWMTGWDGRPTILRSTAERITAVYGELWDVEGPSDRVRMHAARKRWASPWQWLGKDMDDPDERPGPAGREPDWVAVERLAAGEMGWRDRSRFERRLAVQLLWRRGLTINAIGMRLEDTPDPDANAARMVARDLEWLREHGLAQRRAS
jgi:hypothetical protein